jgi:hypothetical protein
MPKTPTFGRYAEIPYDEMTPEQQAGRTENGEGEDFGKAWDSLGGKR